MAKVIHFEIPADDPDRAVAFYKQAFGWRIESWAGPFDYWLAETGDEDEEGIHGAIALRTTVSQPTFTISVPSLDDYLKRVVAAGGKVLAPPNPIPGVGYHAMCQDTEGNVIGVMHRDLSVQ